MVVDSLDAAIADCTLVIGTSTRARRIPWPLLTPRELGERLRREPPHSPIAVLFGREASGLTNDELQRCHLHLQIPANPAYSSLNVAMAVQVVCYELHLATLEARIDAETWDREPASVAAVDGLLVHLEAVLSRVEFLDPDQSRAGDDAVAAAFHAHSTRRYRDQDAAWGTDRD